MTEKALKSLGLNGKLVAVYSRCDEPEVFDVGYITDITDTFVLLYAVDEYGNYDGYCLRLTENIYRLETDSLYLRAIPATEDMERGKTDCGNYGKTFREVFEKLKTSGEMFMAELFNDRRHSVNGYVDNVTDETLTVDEIDGYGNADGQTVVLIDDISAIWTDTRDIKKLKRIECR